MHTTCKVCMETKRPLNRRLTLDRARTVICTLGGVAVKVLLVLIVALVCRFTATAQTTTGVVNGTVTDGSGSVIAGATVTATNTQTGAASSETVGESGRYTITNLTPGLYDIEASSQGFASVVRRNQELLLGTTATVDFSLQVASVAQTVEITGAPPAIETTTSQVDQVIETTQLDTLPTLQRSFSVLAQLTPGVLLNAAGTTVTVGDSGVQASNYIIDGSSVSDQNAGGLTISLAQDWIQEFSVLTQIAPAEYGFATSGIVNAITRSGGNRIHGRAYGYFQNAALNAAPAFLPKSAPNKPPYNQERVGGTFGGPITKDKLFYFLGYERLHSLTSIAINVPPAFDTAGPVNTSSGVFPQSVAQNLAIGKLDYAPSSKNSWHLKGMLQDTVTGNAAIGAGASTITTVSGGDTQVGYTVNYELSWDHTFSSRMLNEARFNFIKDAGNTLDNIRAELGPYTCANALYPGQCDKDGDPVGYYSSVTYTTAQVTVGITSQGCRCEKYVTGADTLTLTSGNHTFKFGTDSGYRGFSNTDLDFNGDGEYTIANGTSPFNPAATAASVFPTRRRLPGPSGYCRETWPQFAHR